jgi:predicted kinase
MEKQLILIASPPASGKTYLSELLAKRLGQVVYLDKDELADLLHAAFRQAGQDIDMDGEFYIKNLRSAEYSTILNIAFSALRFENRVILNAPFGKEVRDAEYMSELKSRANAHGAELILIWINSNADICRKRMAKRNSSRDALKLQSFEEYVKNIDFSPPLELENKKAVDRLIIFDSTSDEGFNRSLSSTMEILKT